MTLKEMKSCAAETLSYFIKSMPDVPFAEEDIIIEFVKKKDMAERAKALCAKYVPDKIINDSQAQQLNSSIAANALTGRSKSAVIFCSDYKCGKRDMRKILFHEFTHIYCAKLELEESKHFIDVYGSGHTPDEHPENEVYDGFLNSGYFVWSEFIAQYYALIKTERPYTFDEAAEYILDLLAEVTISTFELSKGSFSQACAHLLACRDADGVLENFSSPEYMITEDEPYGKETKTALKDCLEYLRNKIRSENPVKITETFIADLGGKFGYFRTMNSFYMGLEM